MPSTSSSSGVRSITANTLSTERGHQLAGEGAGRDP
jgi:hypothetical protein